MVDKFINITDAGNEKAIRRGTRVPSDAVNLAWAKGPKLSPENNIIVIDTSRAVQENVIQDQLKYKIMYADHLGVLQDEYGNQVVQEEYPAIADVFSVDEDFSTVPGSEYRWWHVLPFRHVSRYFHLDHPGLTLGTIAQTYTTDALRVVDENDKDYIDEDGNRKYRVQILPAIQNIVANQTNAAYRVVVYVDTDLNENLYLTYNKAEISPEGFIVNQNINHREIINPQPYFLWKPEESDVVDMNNRRKRWYSTKPVTLKEQVLGTPHPDVEGYKVYVPKKAIPDPRLFQIFRWRVVCDMVESYQVDPVEDLAAIRCGVLVTNGTKSTSPYAFYNLGLSNYNENKVNYLNPISEGMLSKPSKNTAAYWEVNLDTITPEQMQLFDVLLLAPNATTFDTGFYNAKFKYFTETLGNTLIIDTNNQTQLTSFGFALSRPANTSTGAALATGPGTYAKGTTIRIASNAVDDELIAGKTKIGGQNVSTTNDIANLSPYKNTAYTAEGFTQYIVTAPEDYEAILVANRADDVTVSVMVKKVTGSEGNIILTTVGVANAMSALFSRTTGKFIYANNSATIQSLSDYDTTVNAAAIQGAAKIFYNANLLGVKSVPLSSGTVETKYSSTWQFSSPWESSWTINGEVLFEAEKDEFDFAFIPKSPLILDPVWQRKLSNKTVRQLIDENMTTDEITRTSGAQRSYRLEFTNTQIKTSNILGSTSVPYAYTEAYTPRFEVPIEIGAHVIKQEAVKPDYDAAQYIHKAYPQKPFKVNVQGNYDQKTEAAVSHTTTVTVTGTCIETYDAKVTTGGSSPSSSESKLSWKQNSTNQIIPSGRLFEFQAPIPQGMNTWQQYNYYSSNWGPGHEIWPHFGIFGRYDQGSTGEIVYFVQEAMNRFINLGFFNASKLSVDGQYGASTKSTIRAFQTTFQLRYIDGVVDAETLSCIGNQILRAIQAGKSMPANSGDYTKWFANPARYMQIANMSDNNGSTWHVKRSWHSGGPNIVWDLLVIRYNDVHDIHGVTLVPYIEGNAQSMMWSSIDVRTTSGIADLPGLMTNYDGNSAIVNKMGIRANHGEHKYVRCGPYRGNTLIVGYGQDTSSGHGTSRVFGINEVWAHTKVQGVGTPGTTTTETRTRTKTFQHQTTLTVSTGQQVGIQFGGPIEQGNYSDLKFTGVSSSNPKVLVTMSQNGFVNATHQEVVISALTNYTQGPQMPAQTPQDKTALGDLYYIDENNRNNRLPETGFISKAHGIKLLAKSDGSPAGFPALPTAVSANTQRQYATLTVNNLGKDPSVLIGFYDFVKKEFILNKLGAPEISYSEYMARGPQNIYVGVISTHEVAEIRNIPADVNPPTIPFRWAMPVYGLATRSNSNIAIEPLPKDLGPTDVWPIPIRTGSFNKLFDVPVRANKPLVGWLQDYAGTKVRAFYSVVEAERGGWSTLHGRPQIDVIGETPTILDDRVIQVKQPPIYMAQEPTVFPSDADPVNPFFTLYTRDAIGEAWQPRIGDEILDFNASEGTIFLKNPLVSSDPNLVKIDYTTARKIYPFKGWNGERLNLNPYPGHKRDLIGKPIYVYILPALVKDKFGVTIPSSVVERTIHFTLDPSLFQVEDPAYNPLAMQLGVVYITTALDIEDLIILDTRRRGGGIDASISTERALETISDAKSFWDIGFGSGISYQKGGFVIVRLPEELKERFDEEDIKRIIRNNLPVGIAFKVEDLFGNDWT